MTPPWGHKPPAVRDAGAYVLTPPPVLSPRVEYWLRRFSDQTWKPNRRLRRADHETPGRHLGVYLWEYWNLIVPAMAGRDTPA